MVRLTNEQQRILDSVVQDRGTNVFITGSGGVGKSVLLSSITSELRARNVQVVVGAPTGIAAMSIGGQTLHSAFSIRPEYGIEHMDFGDVLPEGIRIGDTIIRYDTLGKTSPGIYAQLMRMGIPKEYSNILSKCIVHRNLDVLIIDEISMVSNDLLLILDKILKYAKGSTAVMGGVQIVAFGDFLQMRPVPTNIQQLQGVTRVPLCFETVGNQCNVWKELNMKVCVLRRPVRFNGSMEVFRVMQVLRMGALTPIHSSIVLNDNSYKAWAWMYDYGDIVDEFMRSLTIDPTDREYADWTWLFPDNASKDSHNMRKLQELTQNKSSIYSISWTVQGTVRDVFSIVPPILQIAVGARVICIKNGQYPSTTGKMYTIRNGQRGIVVAIHTDSIVVNVEDVGYISFTRQTWEYAVMTGSVRRVVSSVTQFPISLAWAMTIHKAQGLTLSNVVLCFNGIHTEGQAYVGISRVRNFDNLRVVGYNRNSIIADVSAVEYYARILEQAYSTGS
jgi:nucleoside-triphosphatase THEP1